MRVAEAMERARKAEAQREREAMKLIKEEREKTTKGKIDYWVFIISDTQDECGICENTISGHRNEEPFEEGRYMAFRGESGCGFSLCEDCGRSLAYEIADEEFISEFLTPEEVK